MQELLTPNISNKTDGQPIGSFYLYKMDGIFQNEAEILIPALSGQNIQTGDVKYVDINNDNVIDAKTVTLVKCHSGDQMVALEFVAKNHKAL